MLKVVQKYYKYNNLYKNKQGKYFEQSIIRKRKNKYPENISIN